MNRRSRMLATIAAILALVFAQIASSAYACAGPVPDPVAMAQMKAAMADDGGLCEKHCGTGVISFEAAKPSFSATAAVMAATLRVVPVEPLAARVPNRAAPVSVAGPAPPLIRFTVLRI
jgi:hypothetical protein